MELYIRNAYRLHPVKTIDTEFPGIPLLPDQIPPVLEQFNVIRLNTSFPGFIPECLIHHANTQTFLHRLGDQFNKLLSPRCRFKHDAVTKPASSADDIGSCYRLKQPPVHGILHDKTRVFDSVFLGDGIIGYFRSKQFFSLPFIVSEGISVNFHFLIYMLRPFPDNGFLCSRTFSEQKGYHPYCKFNFHGFIDL